MSFATRSSDSERSLLRGSTVLASSSSAISRRVSFAIGSRPRPPRNSVDGTSIIEESEAASSDGSQWDGSAPRRPTEREVDLTNDTWLSLRPNEQSGFDLTLDLVHVNPFDRGNWNMGHSATWNTREGTLKVFIKHLRMQNRREIRSVVRVFGEMAGLYHPNVEVLCGLVTDSDIGIVSPFQENSNIMVFLKAQLSHHNITQLKLQLLGDAARGLQYLFEHRIAHGGLRGTNVLITADHRAILSLPTVYWRRVLDSDRSASVSDHSDTSFRWMAPEHVNDDLPMAETLRAGDIWSFGSLCMEVFTGNAPYHELRTKVPVIIQLSQHAPPRRPPQLEDRLWEFCLLCWTAAPSERPAVADLVARLEGLASVYGKQPLGNSPFQLFGCPDVSSEISDVSIVPHIYNDFADIYRGWRTDPGQHGREQVALKVHRIRTAGQATFMECLQLYRGDCSLLLFQKVLRHEISIWSTIQHANILPLYGIFLHAGRPPALVYPWCNFGDAKGFLHLQLANPSLVGRKLLVLDQVFQAVGYLHHHSPAITHGHLKGENVMISSDGTAYLCDFSLSEMSEFPLSEPPAAVGSQALSPKSPAGTTIPQTFWRKAQTLFSRKFFRAKSAAAAATAAAPGRWAAKSSPEVGDEPVYASNPTGGTGSYRWMAPELLEERSRRSPSTDIWACGCLILELVSLNLPYHNCPNDAMVIRALLRNQPPTRPSGIPDELWELAERCWCIEAARRPSIDAVLDAIREARVAYPSTSPDNSLWHAISMPDDATFDTDRSLFVDEDITDRISNIARQISGGGAFSDVYQAEFSTISGSEKVAVKLIREYASKQKALTSLKKEINVWCKLQHPNILPLYGISWGDGQRNLPGMVSPWCSNGDVISYLLAMQGDSQLARIKHKMLKDIIHGLDFLHSHQPPIVHGDLKGANVLVRDNGDACICDFGFSAMTADQFSQSTAPGGTQRWMAPELFVKEYARHTTKSDVWAYGCVVLEVETGSIPYKGHNNVSFVLAINKGEMPASEGAMPSGTWKVAKACWRFDPEKRPTAHALLRTVARARG